MKNLAIVLVALYLLSNVDSYLFQKFKTIRCPIPITSEKPFILTPLIEAGQIDEARNQALVNYSEFQNITTYSGYLQVDKKYDNNLFFYFFPSEHDFKNDPVVLWLQGGPGAPAGYGLFVENGPFIINNNYSVDLREYRWTKHHSVLYIDNPVGTGFSFTTKNGYALNQTKVGDDLYSALIQFFTLFSEIKDNDFFIIGESYAGKYVPAICHTILKKNPTGSLKINLKGLATGNGLSDPVNQANYGDYVYQLGLIDSNTRDTLHKYQSLVKHFIEKENWAKASEYFNGKILELIGDAAKIPSIYKYTQVDQDVEKFWQIYLQEKLRSALHIGNTVFNSGPVFELLSDDIPKSVAPWISELLGYYRFLVYSGQLDIIVAYPLTENYLQNLNFSSAEEYKTAERKIWFDKVGVAGYVKTAGNLTEIMVRNAGHMVPIDQPRRAYNMIYAFVRNMPFPKDE